MARLTVQRRLQQRNEVAELRGILGKYMNPDNLPQEDFDFTEDAIWAKPNRLTAPNTLEMWSNQADISTSNLIHSMLGSSNLLMRQAVYVMASVENISKIGVSNNPMERLRELQVGHPYKLTCHAIVWVSGKAMDLEAAALALCNDRSTRLCGEWVALSWQDALATILEASIMIGARVTPTAGMLADLIAGLLPVHLLRKPSMEAEPACSDRISQFAADAAADASSGRKHGALEFVR